MRLQCPMCAAVLELARRPSFCAECGTPLPPELTEVTPPDPNATTAETPCQDVADSPQRVGSYRLLRQLGAGGMGSVWEGEDDTGRRVAVKLIAPEVAASPEAVARFRREGRLASGLSHPRCVFVLAADEDGGRPYLVMELMPGDSLKDEVERRGPLPVEEAVARILDVMEGLSEAHQRGIVHRDVKPSNCFLDSDGRVKIGDFGLSKSLTADADVSRSGTFLGTPLFASPEQIRRDDVDARSDVWSTAATLYYLLAGRAPFQGGDAAAVMARILADPPPPLRRFRPEVPRGLEQVILRGLERDPARRWQSLDEFRAALAPFTPGRLTLAGLGLRLGAYFLDSTLFQGVILLLGLAVTSAVLNVTSSAGLLLLLLSNPAWAAYYFFFETWWGCSPGKWVCGLRVCQQDSPDPPRLRRGLLRVATYYVLCCLPFDTALLVASFLPLDLYGLLLLYLCWLIGGFGGAVGLVLLVLPMRAANGYRGLHEFVSGTRTVLLPWPERRPRLLPRVPREAAAPDATLPTELGPFEVSGVLGGSPEVRLLCGRDPGLERAVCLSVRPGQTDPLAPTRRNLNRPTRLRWLAGGCDGASAWDAFAAPQGAPLADCVAPGSPLSWGQVRPILTQLAEELAAAADEGTLPATLGPEQVYVQPSGRTQLLDAGPSGAAGEGPDARSLALLRDAAILALEGRPRPDSARTTPVRAPLPLHAGRIVDRLVGASKPYATLAEFRAELEATRDRPAEVTVPLRAAHLGILFVLVLVPLSCTASGSAICTSATLTTAALALPDYERNLELLPASEKEREASLRLSYGTPAQQRAVENVRRDSAGQRVAAAQPSLEWLLLSSAGPPPVLVRRLCDEVARCQQFQQRSRAAEQQVLDNFDRSWGPTRLKRELVKLRAEKEAERVELERWVAEARVEHERRRRATAAWVGAGGSGMLEAVEEPIRRRAAERWYYYKLGPPFHDAFARSVAVAGVVMTVLWPAVWVLWTFLLRGGLSYRLAGLMPVRYDGARAGRLRLAWRALVVWGPTATLLAVAVLVEAFHPEWVGLPQGLFAVAWLMLLGLAVSGLRHPTRALHDRLSGVTLVPR